MCFALFFLADIESKDVATLPWENLATMRECRIQITMENYESTSIITKVSLFFLYYCMVFTTIGKTPIRIILWCPTANMLIKTCFLIQPLEQEGGCQKCCIYLCSKVFINHFYHMKASPECLNILINWSQYWVDTRQTEKKPKMKSLNRNNFSTDIWTLPIYLTSSCPHRLQRS